MSTINIMDAKNTDDMIREYFMNGLTYKEIMAMLNSRHGISISIRQLHRMLRRLQLFRRRKRTDVNNVITEVAAELQTSSSSFGHRQMFQKIRMKGIVTDKETVRLTVKALDPDGVQNRLQHRLTRRQYVNPGPNYSWHVDGYDKLKPYGLAVHGAIDGYSRRILWLYVGSTNNNPALIGKYFVNYINCLLLYQ